MKTIYTIDIATKSEITSISPEFESESEARDFFEKEKAKLSDDKLADISEWGDYDQAWSTVYKLELNKLTVDDENDNYPEDLETIDDTDYYYLDM